MGFGDVAALAVASLDLELVKLLRGAILAADIAGGKFGPAGMAGGAGPSATFEPRPRIHPEPQILPRRRVHPTPRIEPRRVIHPTPRIALQCVEASCTDAACSPEISPPCPSPIQPPWKVLVWQTPVPPRPILKVVRYKTDISHKGLMLDVFI